MANRIKGITVEIGGDTTKLQTALKGVNGDINKTQSQLKDVNKLLKLDPGNTELIAQKQKLLANAVSETKEKLETLKTAANQANDALSKGDISKEQYDALQREIIETEKNLESLTDAQNDFVKSGSKIDSVSSKIDGFGNKAVSASGKLKGLSKGAGTIAAAAIGAAFATDEFSTDLSKLRNNADNTGIGLKSAENAFDTFAIATDEVDSSVEGVSNLMQAGFTESNLQTAVEGLTGAYLKFPDTLKIEGLADSLQETLATGKSIGMFGEMLDRVGYGAENFDAELSKCNSEAEKQNLIMKVLSEEGLNSTYNKWQENNKVLLEQKKALLNAQKAMSDFGGAISEIIMPVLGPLVEMLQTLASKFSGINIRTRQIIGGIILFIAALAPLLSIIGRASIGVSALVGAFGKIKGVVSVVSPALSIIKTLISGLGGVAVTIGKALLTGIGVLKTALSGLFAVMMANPIFLIIAAVVALVAGFILLWHKSEGFRQFWIGLWENIKNVVNIVWEAIKNFLSTIWTAISNIAINIWTGIKNFFVTLWNGIKSVFTTILNAIKTVITAYFNIYKTIISTVLNIIKKIISTIWSSIKTVVTMVLTGIKNTVSSVWNGIKSIISKILNIIKALIVNTFNTMWNGIKTVMGGIYNTIKDGFDKAVGFIKGLASSAFNWGKDIIMGIVKGIKSCIGAVGDAVKGVANKIKSFLHFSVPDEGPLTDYESWMPDFMGGLAKGIENSRSLIQKAVSGVSSDMVISPNVQTGRSAASFGTENSRGYAVEIGTAIKEALSDINGKEGDIVIPVYLGGTIIDEVIVTAQQRNNLRSGGR